LDLEKWQCCHPHIVLTCLMML